MGQNHAFDMGGLGDLSDHGRRHVQAPLDSDRQSRFRTLTRLASLAALLACFEWLRQIGQMPRELPTTGLRF